MLLNYHQICSVAQGVVNITGADGRIQFHRFTATQEETYRTTSADFYSKSFATAGVRLSFVTDSAFVRLGYRLSRGSSRYYGWFDVYENGALVDHFGGEFQEFVEGEGCTRLSAGKKRVDIYFPWSATAELTALELSDGASLEPVAKKGLMVAYGDSITQGYDAQYPSMSYQNRIADCLDMECINKGIGAEEFFPALPDPAGDVQPELITVAYGTNDWSHRDAKGFEDKCRGFLQNLTRGFPNARILVITPIWRHDRERISAFGQPLSAAVALMHSICAEFPGITVVDGENLAPHHLGFYSPDGLHPNDLGFAHYGNALCRELDRVLGQ